MGVHLFVSSRPRRPVNRGFVSRSTCSCTRKKPFGTGRRHGRPHSHLLRLFSRPLTGPREGESPTSLLVLLLRLFLRLGHAAQSQQHPPSGHSYLRTQGDVHVAHKTPTSPRDHYRRHSALPCRRHWRRGQPLTVNCSGGPVVGLPSFPPAKAARREP